MIVAAGNNLKSFIYDTFDDSSINGTLWNLDYVNGLVGAPSSGGFNYRITNQETAGYLELNALLSEDFSSGQSGATTVNNVIHANSSNINMWTANQIDFE